MAVEVMTPAEAWENASPELRARADAGEITLAGCRCSFSLTPEQVKMLEERGLAESFVKWAERALALKVAQLI